MTKYNIIKTWIAIIILTIWAVPVFAQVDTAWVRRYDTGAWMEEYEGGKAIAVDISGNCYVTGNTATIKYDPDGNELWIRKYHSVDMVIDVSGNVYTIGGDAAYFITKYYPDGDTAWVRRYDGPANGKDWGRAIVVDDFYNVFVTGKSWGNETDYDYATVKFDSSGNQLWVRRYNGPGNSHDEAVAIGLDDDGNVSVTGKSLGNGTGTDYATIKYDPDGNKLWERRYNGPGNGEDCAQDLTIHGEGNVCVTGYSYDSETTYCDYATVKYSSTGSELWIQRYNGPGNGDDIPSDIAIDGWANLYVTGRSPGIDTFDDYATIKYDASGNELWVVRYETNHSDQARALACDQFRNIYVTGSSAGGLDDYVTVKYDVDGNQVWVARYNNPITYSYDRAYDVVVDLSGNVYVTGWSVGSYWDPYWYIYLNYDYATIKYVQDETFVEEEKTTGDIRWLSLNQNYPNPFNTKTAIEYSLRNPAHTSLEIYNVTGQLTKSLVDQHQHAGLHRVVWDGKDHKGNEVSTGIYFYRLKAGDLTQTKKMVFLK